jgi:serine/threonine protein phosphatase PrpC
VATPVTSHHGNESPLDVGWTGAVASPREPPKTPPDGMPDGPACEHCHEGHVVDGYCDVCGSPPRDPRDHFTEQPAPWVAGVCDIGIRHTRNEDGMATDADPGPGSRAVAVVCDGVSNTTDSHIASLAAARAARDVLAAPSPQGVGTRESRVAAQRIALIEAVSAAARAVEATVAPGTENPPSSTFVAAVVDHGLVVVGNVGDSRAYWLPDAPTSQPRQLSTDDSWAGERIRAGTDREEAETGPHAHAITRWLGTDSPADLTPHCADLDLVEPGWLLVCSDGLWNYCSDAVALRSLVAERVAALDPDAHAGVAPLALAGALVEFANSRGGADNITVALMRADGSGSAPGSRVNATAEEVVSTDG